jgi:hypothetical protein
MQVLLVLALTSHQQQSQYHHFGQAWVMIFVSFINL